MNVSFIKMSSRMNTDPDVLDAVVFLDTGPKPKELTKRGNKDAVMGWLVDMVFSEKFLYGIVSDGFILVKHRDQ